MTNFVPHSTITARSTQPRLKDRLVELVARRSSRRVAHLSVLRGLAILMVIAAHFNVTRTSPYAVEISLAFANCGVILFFFLSGFLMDQTLARDNRFFPFAIRRVLRILPMYWVSILVVFATGAVWTVWDVIANATFLAPALRTDRMLGVYWTLYIEVLFYCVVPFVRYAG